MGEQREDFGGYDYATTFAYWRYTTKNPGDVRNSETRAEWFARCHQITVDEFAEIVRSRGAPIKPGRNLADKNRPHMGRGRRK